MSGFKLEFTAGVQETFTISYVNAAGSTDITGATFAAKVRASLNPGSDELIDLTSDVAITGDATLGVITVSIGSARTSTYELTGLSGYYEITMLLNGERIVLIPPSPFALGWRLSA